MYSITLLTKDKLEIIQEKVFQYKSNSSTSKDLTIITSSVLDIIKDIDSLTPSDYFSIVIENKAIVYRKSKESKLALLIQGDKVKFKTSDLEEISRVMLSMLEKKYFSETLNKSHVIEINLKELIFASLEELTINFLELLKKSKLYAKFIYFNYNPFFINSFSYKKVKNEAASVILYNQKQENDKLTEVKDTMLQKSTIKEKELCIELDKKSFPPTDKRIYIKKFSDLKPDTFKKKNLSKYYSTNQVIEKYVCIYYLIL